MVVVGETDLRGLRAFGEATGAGAGSSTAAATFLATLALGERGAETGASFLGDNGFSSLFSLTGAAGASGPMASRRVRDL